MEIIIGIAIFTWCFIGEKIKIAGAKEYCRQDYLSEIKQSKEQQTFIR